MLLTRSTLGNWFAEGSYGSSSLTREQWEATAETVQELRYYEMKFWPIDCIDDRLSGGGGLAGGGLSLALMHHYIHGGERLSDNLRGLSRLGVPLSLHTGCGALELARRVVSELSSPSCQVYELLDRLGLPSGSRSHRDAIAIWASGMPQNYIDAEPSLQLVRHGLGDFGSVTEPIGDHKTSCVLVNHRWGEVFLGSHEMAIRTDGYRPLLVNAWAPRRTSGLLSYDREVCQVAEVIAFAFTFAVICKLGDATLDIFQQL